MTGAGEGAGKLGSPHSGVNREIRKIFEILERPGGFFASPSRSARCGPSSGP